MPTTPNLGLPYPTLSDNADVPQDIQALADKLDAILGGGGGGGGTGSLPLSNAPVLDVGRLNQVRAGRQLATADFTSLGLSVPVGLFNLSSLANLGSGGPLVNLGAVPFGVGINGLATTCAVFAGSSGQALYIADTGAADPFRIRTGSFGCWFRTAKRSTSQVLVSKYGATNAVSSFLVQVGGTTNAIQLLVNNGAGLGNYNAVSDVADDRWHHVVCTHDGQMARIYVDGMLESVNVTGEFPLNAGATAPLNIGANGADGSTAAGSPTYGRVDEAFVTADVLTEDEVRLLYASRLAHALGAIPTSARMAVHRRRKGGAYAVTDFPAQPVRLHNFTGGALTDQGTGGVALTPVGGGSIVDVAGPDGIPAGAKSFSGAHTGLGATDAGLPGGLTARTYGCWFKTTSGTTIMAWGNFGGAADARADIASGNLRVLSGGDVITGPYVADGQWHLLTVVEDNVAGDGVKRKAYLDGRLVGSSTVLTSLGLVGANAFRVGATPTGTSPFVGQIDAAFVAASAYTLADVQTLYSKGVQDLGASPKNSGDHVERLDATSVLFIADTLESQHTVDLGVVA